MNDLMLRNPAYLPEILGAAENPVTALAKVRPDLAYDILNQEIGLRKREQNMGRYAAELATVRGVISEQTTQMCEWLRNRHPGEIAAEAESRVASGESAFIFGRSSYVHAKSTFRITRG